MENIKTKKCKTCGAETNIEDLPPNYSNYSKYILISMIKKKGLALKYGFTRSKPELVEILTRLDEGVDPKEILKEQRDLLYC